MTLVLNEICQPNTQKGVFTGTSIVSETAESFPIYYCNFLPHLLGYKLFPQKLPPYLVLRSIPEIMALLQLSTS